MRILGRYKNGNITTTILDDGTKIRRTEDDEFRPLYAENCDVKITDHCDGGCPMCYEGCTTKGKHGQLFDYPNLIESLHPYTELALNGNDLSHPLLVPFLSKLKEKKVIANLTVNQIHFERYYNFICDIVESNLIHGLGISLNNPTDNFITKVKHFPNAVIHTINGVLTQEQAEKLADNDLKILILGYKYMERGVSYYQDNENELKANQAWLYNHLDKLTQRFKCVSFDNLAIKQLDVKRLMSEEEWETFYMGDDGSFTFYIDMVDGTFGKNSLTPKDKRIPIGDKTIDEMFQIVRNNNWD